MRTPEPGRAPRLARTAAVALALVTAGAAATYTPLFSAREIRIAGTDMGRAEILAIADVDDRTNVVHLDTAEVERRLERDPRILRATVSTGLPGTLSLVIEPRKPVAVIGEPLSFVGADGVVIGPAPHGDGLPRLQGRDLGTAASAAAAMPTTLRRAVNSIVVRADGGIGVRLAAGFSADLGDRSQLEAKAASLTALLDWADAQDVRILSADVTVPSSPTVKLDEGKTVTPSA